MKTYTDTDTLGVKLPTGNIYLLDHNPITYSYYRTEPVFQISASLRLMGSHINTLFPAKIRTGFVIYVERFKHLWHFVCVFLTGLKWFKLFT